MLTTQLFGTELPIVQAPMAGVQVSALAVAVSNAGGLGSLPCAMLGEAMRSELAAITAQTRKPYNVNFFCHATPAPSAERESAWRAALAPHTGAQCRDRSGFGKAPALVFTHRSADAGSRCDRRRGSGRVPLVGIAIGSTRRYSS